MKKFDVAIDTLGKEYSNGKVKICKRTFTSVVLQILQLQKYHECLFKNLNMVSQIVMWKPQNPYCCQHFLVANKFEFINAINEWEHYVSYTPLMENETKQAYNILSQALFANNIDRDKEFSSSERDIFGGFRKALHKLEKCFDIQMLDAQ